MARVLFAWLGHTDLKASKGEDVGAGPIAQAVGFREFDEAVLLSDQDEAIAEHYRAWLQDRTKTKITIRPEPLSGPTQFGEIYPAVVRNVEAVLEKEGRDTELGFHISPGTPPMAAVWIILARTRYPAELLESSREHGVRVVSFPFEIAAEFIPDLLRTADRDLERRALALPPEAPEFESILHRSSAMKRVLAVARRAAFRSVRVLIEGETGTGKELVARAIHDASPRKREPFKTVNCGAIAKDLVEAELFGHERGAFTGAEKTRKGKFEEANGGTIFLDEIGELPLPAQVTLLRVLQEGRVTRVGGSDEIPVDVRVVAATNRTLIKEVAARRFREDLYYRLAVVVLRLPPLREREGDVGILLDRFLDRINEEPVQGRIPEKKRLSPAARRRLLKHSWPGNVRELENVLNRLVVWAERPVIEEGDVVATLDVGESRNADVLERSFGGDFKLQELLDEVARHYLTRAMKEANGELTEAARLTGLASHQTLSNWLRRYGLEELKKQR